MVIRPSGLSKILKLLGTFNRPASTRSLRGALFSCRHSTASVFLCHFEISSLIPRTTSQLAVVVLALHRTFSQAFRNNCSFLHRALNARGATLACGCDVGSRIARHNRRCMLSSTPNGATHMLRDQKELGNKLATYAGHDHCLFFPSECPSLTRLAPTTHSSKHAGVFL
jgi:hypothetical protein